ncbi:hypothetical protein CRUP_009715 [Coryphaenoides rupestris]|nr:hypothetical protein CRUP_009715 [Coryphaenoides rupestris]
MTQAEREQENGKEREKDREKEKDKEQQRGVKRPIVPASIPESLQEQIQTNFVVVIHPGSRTLRIGRATDTVPVSVPHVIARRHKQSGQPRHEDPWLLRAGLHKPESNEQRQNGLKMVEQAIWSKKMSSGVRRTPVSAEQYLVLFALSTKQIVLIMRVLWVTLGTSSKCSADRKPLSRPGGVVDGELMGQGCGVEPSDPHRLSGGGGAGASQQAELDLGPAQAECLMGAGEAEEQQPSALLSRKSAIMGQFESKALGLDKAILHSIDCCASDETKRKMYSSILVVGGGLMFHGAQEFLLHRIINKMPPSFRRLVDNVEVITRPKDMDPWLISWKGAAVLACLDTSQEMWIHQREWQRFGVRMLRERAAFVW